MTKSNFLKLTAILFLIPFVNIYFNKSVSPSHRDAFTNEVCLNSLVGQTGSHQSCFIPHLDREAIVMETPDFGSEMGKYIKDNFGNEDNYKIRTVVIDPGHGGRDGGTSGKYAVEKDIALKIANHLGANLRYNYPNIRVLHTRTDDRFIPLDERARIANESQADLFISIHCNSLPDSPINNRVKGSETYVMGLHTAEQNLNVAKRENASILYEQNYQQRYDGYDPNSPEGHIILSMFQNAYLGQSILLAEEIEGKLANSASRNSLGVKQAGFVVLKQTTMPSVLVETGYLSNAEDELYLSSETGQSKMSMSILDAFTAYKNSVEDNNINYQPVAASVKNVETMTIGNTVIKVSQKAVIEPNNSAILNNNATNIQNTQPASRGMAPTLMVNDKENINNNITITGKIEYKILLATSQNLLDTSKSPWKDVDYSVQMIKENETYKYLVIGFQDKAAATKVKDEMRAKGFKEAFVVGYQGSRRLF